MPLCSVVPHAKDECFGFSVQYIVGNDIEVPKSYLV